MSKSKARIVLHPRVAKTIKWLTHNFDKEIGAVGLGEIKDIDGYPSFYVDELLFPKQEVTSATVSIKPESWVELRKEYGAEKLTRMMFYWHRHPSGSAGCSGTDEEDTFGTFMSDKAGRKYFVFLQTATSGTGIVHEARIDVRDPFRVTITNGDIDLVTELSEDEKEIKKMCEDVIENKVTEKIYQTTTTTWDNKTWNSYSKPKTFEQYKKEESLAKTKSLVDVNNEALKKLFNFKQQPQAILGDIFLNKDFSDETKTAIAFVNGEVQVMCGNEFAKVLDNELRDKILGFAREHKKTEYLAKEGWWIYKIQPAANSYDKLKLEMEGIYMRYKDEINEDNNYVENETNKFIIEEQEILLSEIMGTIYEKYEVDYAYESADEGGFMDVLTTKGKYLGNITINNNWSSAVFRGEKLVTIVTDEIEKIMSTADGKSFYSDLEIEDITEEEEMNNYTQEIKQLALIKTDKTKKRKKK